MSVAVVYFILKYMFFFLRLKMSECDVDANADDMLRANV
jgi:hypothetical protein